MEEQLSLLELVVNASLTVQAVMLLLVLASMFSWYMIVNRFIYFRNARDEMYRFEEQFWSGIDLSQLYREGNERSQDGHAILGMESIFRAGFKEFSRLAQQPEADSEAVIEGSRRAMRVAAMREEERLERHLPFLASVGSTSPYIGLFGTVYGIMNSFQSIAITKQTSLAVVAPGIAEALFATALGLVAAIPAVVAYNKISTDLTRYAGRLEAFAHEFSGILSRQLEEAD